MRHCIERMLLVVVVFQLRMSGGGVEETIPALWQRLNIVGVAGAN